ncbi:MAG: hypothetical protein ABI579_08695 [Candidatus Sumerlaeota bacterium]
MARRRKRAGKGGHQGSFHNLYRTPHHAESAAIRHSFRDVSHSKTGEGIHEFDLTQREDVRKFVQSPDFGRRVSDMEGIITFLQGDSGAAPAKKQMGRPKGSGKKKPGRPAGTTAAKAADAAPKVTASKKKKRIRRTGAELAAAKREVEIRKAVTKRLKMNKPGKRSAEDTAKLESEIKKEMAKK